MKKTFLATALAATIGSGAANQPMTWSKAELFDTPRTVSDAGLDKVYRADGVRSFLLEGPRNAKGEETFAYAYYALPSGEAPQGGFPAVVLVHGGGGTAFSEYVKHWRDRGYAVITFDHYGQEPATALARPDRPILTGSWQDKSGKIFGEADPEMRHLWVHNGVALIVRANTFLRDQKEINPDKIGLLGISWGSVMGSIAASFDHRFAFAAFCYGCGNWDLGVDGSFVKYANDSFEPKYFVKDLTVPSLWVAGTNDSAFEISQWQKTWQSAPGTKAASLVVRLDHDHVGWDYAIVRRFADSFTGKDGRLPAVSTLTVKDGVAKAAILDAGDKIKRAELIYSTEKPGIQRLWQCVPAEVGANTVSAKIPENAKAVGLAVFDREYDGPWQFPVSTDVVELAW